MVHGQSSDGFISVSGFGGETRSYAAYFTSGWIFLLRYLFRYPEDSLKLLRLSNFTGGEHVVTLNHW